MSWTSSTASVPSKPDKVDMVIGRDSKQNQNLMIYGQSHRGKVFYISY